jgi:apolipoprotein N-acyltransferase
VAGGPLSPRARALWLGGYVLATFLSFPHPVAGRVLDLGIGVSWLGPALLLAGLRGLAPGAAARWAYAAGWVAHSAVIHWIYVVTVTYGHAPPPIGVVAPMALALYMAAFTGAFGAVWGWLGARGAAGVLAAALAWTALDHARSFFLTGFPWATLGYAQHGNPALLGIVRVTGVYGLSFATALGGAALFELAGALRARRAAPRAALAALAAVALLHGVGWWLFRGEAAADGPRLRVAALQGNIDQGVKWSPAWQDRTVAIYEQLSRDAVADGAQLLVWPESAVPGVIELEDGLRRRLEALARGLGVPMVVGSVGFDPEAGGEDLRLFDSAFLLAPTGRILDRYDKSHLVPFGEYVPLRALLGHFLGAVARGIASRDVSAGPAPRALRVPLPPEAGGGALQVGVPICYELLFPDLVRRFVDEGARLLLAITNDAWYGRTGAPYQFLAITALRSAETGVWTVRAANTGVSAVIDGRGRVRKATGIFERGSLVADVPLRLPDAGSTFYVRHGDVFAWSCWAGLAALAAAAGWRRGREAA